MKDYVEVDMDMLLVSLYNRGAENKIFINDEDFINNTFDDSYSAAWAVSLSGRWRRTDDFVYFDSEGYLTSFSHWDDERSPINLDKLDISQLINSLKKRQKRYAVNSIPRAIHDALK